MLPREIIQQKKKIILGKSSEVLCLSHNKHWQLVLYFPVLFTMLSVPVIVSIFLLKLQLKTRIQILIDEILSVHQSVTG